MIQVYKKQTEIYIQAKQYEHILQWISKTSRTIKTKKRNTINDEKMSIFIGKKDTTRLETITAEQT